MKLYQNVMVGLLFFGALFMIGFFTIVSERGPFTARGKQIVVFFENAEGIKLGSKVTVIGVPGGYVEEISIVPVDKYERVVEPDSRDQVGQRVAVTLDLKQELVFYENYSIDIKNASLLGGKVISIYPGSAVALSEEEENIKEQQAPRNKPISVFYASVGRFSDSALQQYLQARLEGDFVELQGQSSGDPIAGLSELISENRQNVRETLQNVRDITDKISKGKGTLGLLVNDDELHRNASTLLSDAQIVVRELREGLEDQREQAPVNSFFRAALTAF